MCIRDRFRSISSQLSQRKRIKIIFYQTSGSRFIDFICHIKRRRASDNKSFFLPTCLAPNNTITFLRLKSARIDFRISRSSITTFFYKDIIFSITTEKIVLAKLQTVIISVLLYIPVQTILTRQTYFILIYAASSLIPT